MRVLLAMLLLWSVSLGAALPDTPLLPTYNALFTGRVAQAWQQLILAWPRLDSEAQKTAWAATAKAIIAQQCGKDVALPIPPWLDQPTLRFIQRDMPLNRVYRVEIEGSSQYRDLQLSLKLPNGSLLLNKRVPSYSAKDSFSLESPEITQPFSQGVYVLTISAGKEVWQQSLILAQDEVLNWVYQERQQLHFTLPDTPANCPAPWIEQNLLRRDNFDDVWWKRADAGQPLQWPPRFNPAQDSLWASVTLIKAQAQGGVTLRQEHRFAGPLSLFVTPDKP